MKKKFLFSILALCLMLPSIFIFAGCNEGEPSNELLKNGDYKVEGYYIDGVEQTINIGQFLTIQNGQGTDWNGNAFTVSAQSNNITLSYIGEHPLTLYGQYHDNTIIFDTTVEDSDYYIVLIRQEPVKEGDYKVLSLKIDGQEQTASVGNFLVLKDGVLTDENSDLTLQLTILGDTVVARNQEGDHMIRLAGKVINEIMILEGTFYDGQAMLMLQYVPRVEIANGDYTIADYKLNGTSIEEYLGKTFTISDNSVYYEGSEVGTISCQGENIELSLQITEGQSQQLEGKRFDNSFVFYGSWSSGDHGQTIYLLLNA